MLYLSNAPLIFKIAIVRVKVLAHQYDYVSIKLKPVLLRFDQIMI